MGDLRRILVARRTVVAAGTGTGQDAALFDGDGQRSQTQGSASGIRGDRLRPAHGLSMESVAGNALRQRECNPQAISRMGKGRGVRSTRAGRAGRIRRIAFARCGAGQILFGDQSAAISPAPIRPGLPFSVSRCREAFTGVRSRFFARSHRHGLAIRRGRGLVAQRVPSNDNHWRLMMGEILRKIAAVLLTGLTLAWCAATSADAGSPASNQCNRHEWPMRACY